MAEASTTAELYHRVAPPVARHAVQEARTCCRQPIFYRDVAYTPTAPVAYATSPTYVAPGYTVVVPHY
ncbi:MAG: hypothetical protein ACXWJM_02750 [Ramlibacter sp.]